MHSMPKTKDHASPRSRPIYGMILPIGAAVLFVCGCANHASAPPPPAVSDGPATSGVSSAAANQLRLSSSIQQIQNNPNMTPTQKQNAIQELNERAAQMSGAAPQQPR